MCLVGFVKRVLYCNVLKRVAKRANGLQISDEECENLRDCVYFATIVDIFPRVETNFWSRSGTSLCVGCTRLQVLLNDRCPTSKCVHQCVAANCCWKVVDDSTLSLSLESCNCGRAEGVEPQSCACGGAECIEPCNIRGSDITKVL